MALSTTYILKKRGIPIHLVGFNSYSRFEHEIYSRVKFIEQEVWVKMAMEKEKLQVDSVHQVG